MAKSISKWSDEFLAQMEAIRLGSEDKYKAAIGEKQNDVPMLDKGDWTGNPTDHDGLTDAFSRESLDEQFGDIIQDPENKGVSGDLQAITLQGDMLAAYERATRSRLMSKPRAMLHAAARKRGHGSIGGPVTKGFVETIASIMNKSKTTNE